MLHLNIAAAMAVLSWVVTSAGGVMGCAAGIAWGAGHRRTAGWWMAANVCTLAFYIGLRIGYSVWTAHHGAL